MLIAFSVLPAQARRQVKFQTPSGGSRRCCGTFERILDSWRDGRYAELYEQTSRVKEEGKEVFAKRLAPAPRRPACCWEKMQEVRISMKSDRAATVRARLGFEGNVTGTDFITKAIKLKGEDNVWVISQAELFSLSNLVKKRTRYKYLPIQTK